MIMMTIMITITITITIHRSPIAHLTRESCSSRRLTAIVNIHNKNDDDDDNNDDDDDDDLKTHDY